MARRESSYAADYKTVTTFLTLQGAGTRPVDKQVFVRSRTEFSAIRKLLPRWFFEPFNSLRAMLELEPLVVEPSESQIADWNQEHYVRTMVDRTQQFLDRGGRPRLIPTLVRVYSNLNHQRVPPKSALSKLSAIVVPGSRSFDRAIEAYHYFNLCSGRPYLITTGKAPYYDADNSGLQITEAAANSAYWRMLGIPEEMIIAEGDSQDTSENADFLLAALDNLPRLSKPKSTCLLLVTSPFHLARYRLNVQMSLAAANRQVDVFAVGSRSNRYYGAEFYFYTDPKAGYERSSTLATVFNEYLKIAFDLCAKKRSAQAKKEALRL